MGFGFGVWVWGLGLGLGFGGEDMVHLHGQAAGGQQHEGAQARHHTTQQLLDHLLRVKIRVKVRVSGQGQGSGRVQGQG